MEHTPPRDALRLYLRALFGREAGTFVEIAHRFERGRTKGPMHRGRSGIFRPVVRLEAIASEIERFCRREHVWVGVAPRRPHPKTAELGGKKTNVAPARVVWVDCDLDETPDALERLRAFQPRPNMLVDSGGGYHAYWLLRDPIGDPDELRAQNERLALALGADRQSADAARILRPPGTRNFKSEYGDPRPVRLLFFDQLPLRSLEEVVGALDVPTPERRRSTLRSEAERLRDPLRRISPPDYFRTLVGLERDWAGKVSCPLPGHDDPDPSCHVYETATEGWYCYGCGGGGDIYELAGELWRMPREGRDFLELRERLQLVFGLDGGIRARGRPP
jgi:hypothetical protein